MYHLMKEIVKNLKIHIEQNHGLLLKLCCMILTALFLAGFSSYQAEASAGIKLYDYSTKSTTTYTGKQIKVTYNKTVIGYKDTPGILVDGIALLPYYDLFKSSGIAADCVYDKTKGTVTISKYGTTIVMTIGSKSATVNGKAVTMSVAPVKIKYVDVNKTKILVPSRFVSETLGLGYTWFSDLSTVAIEKYTIQLSYNEDEKFEYSGIQGKVTFDGKRINLDTMPSIINNNTAMVRAKKVFSDSAIGASYYFNKEDKTVTLMKGENVLIMTIGSTKALLNNKSVQLDAAPLIVKNIETGSSYVMVPGGFTSASLGFDYTWNKKTNTSMITTRVSGSDTSDNAAGSDPELGDSGVTNETGTILNQWNSVTSTYGTYSGIHELSGFSTGQGNIYYASRDYNNLMQNAETFMVVASSPFGKVTASDAGNLITVTADHVTCTDMTYQMYGISSNFVNTIGIYNGENNSSSVELEVLPANYKYELSFSADNTILYITVYLNTITSAVVGKNSSGDYLTLTGAAPLSANITVQSSFMYINLPYTTLSTGDFFSDISGADVIKQIYTSYNSDKTQIILALKEGYEYYLMENGNQYTVSFKKPGGNGGQTEDTDTSDHSSDLPEETDEPDDSVSVEIPAVKDVSRYEIVIPRPAEIATSEITNEDYYFNNYFVIRIPGDYTQFYKSNNISYTSGIIDKISITLNSNNETVIKIATTKLQGYELAADSNNLYVNIGAPKDIYKNIVLLDPGHGGSANGAQYYGTKEKDVNFTILYTIGKKYFNSDASKLKVYYTRTSDSNPSLSERAAMVKTFGADLFVSLHMNAADATVVGTEVFYSVKNNITNSAGLSADKLASILVTSLTNKLGTDSRGVKKEDYTVIYKNTVPAVLIELGFLSTKSDYKNLIDPTFQENTAETIYETLLQIFKDYPTGRY